MIWYGYFLCINGDFAQITKIGFSVLLTPYQFIINIVAYNLTFKFKYFIYCVILMNDTLSSRRNFITITNNLVIDFFRRRCGIKIFTSSAKLPSIKIHWISENDYYLFFLVSENFTEDLTSEATIDHNNNSVTK